MTMTDDKELLPCPFCGSANVDPTYSLGSRSDGTHVHAAGCDVCGAVGPDTPDDSKIGEAWNRRAPPAAVESQGVDAYLLGTAVDRTHFDGEEIKQSAIDPKDIFVTSQPLEAEAAMLKVCRLADRVVARIGMLGDITSDDEHVVALLQALKELDPNAVIQSDPVPWMQRAGAVCT